MTETESTKTQEEISRLQKKLWEVEVSEKKDICKSMVGKYFKTNPLYDFYAPKSWVYYYIKKITKELNLIVDFFEVSPDGIYVSFSTSKDPDYLSDALCITEAEYNREKAKVQKKIANWGKK